MDILVFDDAAQWEAWLAEHYASSSGVWLRVGKKNSGKVSITITEALDVALCYGWIDSQRKAYDEAHFLQRYSPRRPNGAWSKVNIEKAEALITAGRMREPGMAEVLAAKADGRWDAAYESQRIATVPPELAAILERNERAKRAFEVLGRTDRYLMLLPVLKARTTAAREKRLQTVIAALEGAGAP